MFLLLCTQRPLRDAGVVVRRIATGVCLVLPRIVAEPVLLDQGGIGSPGYFVSKVPVALLFCGLLRAAGEARSAGEFGAVSAALLFDQHNVVEPGVTRRGI